MKYKMIILSILFLPVLLFGVELKSLYFEGNHAFTSSELYDALALKRPSFIAFWKSKIPKINPKTALVLKESLEGFYQVKGFYKAKIAVTQNQKKIIFRIKENKPVIVKNIDIRSDEKINDLIFLDKGNRFDAELFIKSKKQIKEKMLKLGYCSYDLNAKAKVDPQKNLAYLHFFLKKGEICKFGDITLSGLETIKPKIIKSYISFHKGDDYSYDKIIKSYDALYSLGAFSSVTIKETQKINNVLKMNISFRERKKKIRLKTGIGYESDLGPRAFLRWEERNFRGNAKKLAFFLKYSQKEHIFKNELTKPALFAVKGHLFNLKNEAGYSYFDYDTYKEKTLFDKIHLFHSFGYYLVDIGVGIENIKISDVKNLCNIEEKSYLLIYPFLSFIRDSRDSRLNPRKGTYFSHYMEGGLKEFGSDTSYIKMEDEGRFIYTFSNKITLALKAKIKIIKELKKDLPESKMLFGGGAYGNRAYGYKKLYATDALCSDMGGKTFVENTIEISHPIYKEIEGAVFLDSTMLSADSFDFSTDFIHSFGFGVRYISPIGPVKLDFGFNMEEPGINAIHFLIGQSF